jgi:putative nucleotidyltransferase with HDIG domain
VFSEYQNQNNFPISVDAIWQHSLHVSNLAFMMARSLKLEDRECDDARVSGILHDIGLLLSFQIPGFFDHVKFMETGQVFIESELEYLGTSHAQMGGYLLGIWGLPNPIVEAVTYHHFPGMQLASQPGLLTALHLANGLLNMYQNEKDGNFDPYLDMQYLRMLGLADRLSDWVPMIGDYMIKSTPL